MLKACIVFKSAHRSFCFALVIFSLWSTSSAGQTEDCDLGKLRAGDFVEDLTGHQTGPRSMELVLTLTNPTSTSICVYEGIFTLSDVVLASHPDRRIEGIINDPDSVENIVYGGDDVAKIKHKYSSIARNKFRPNIKITPGASYSFHQKRSYDEYVLLHGDALDGVGMQLFPAEASHYKVKIRGLQIFLCDRAGFFIRNSVQKKVLTFGRRGQGPISSNEPNGIYWRFNNVLEGTSFLLSLPNPPIDKPLVIYD